MKILRKNVAHRLVLVYGDQKTVYTIASVTTEWKGSHDEAARCAWIQPIPSLFHAMNRMDLIFDTYGGGEDAQHPMTQPTLLHPKNHTQYVQGHSSPFHHKEGCDCLFQIVAMFYGRIKSETDIREPDDLHAYSFSMVPVVFLQHVRAIRETVYIPTESVNPVDEITVHGRFLRDMKTYLSFKRAMKYAIMEIMCRMYERMFLISRGGRRAKYTQLYLYMVWLTRSGAADTDLARAAIANTLVNLRGTSDGWFEIDRLNEFSYLKMKT